MRLDRPLGRRQNKYNRCSFRSKVISAAADMMSSLGLKDIGRLAQVNDYKAFLDFFHFYL